MNRRTGSRYTTANPITVTVVHRSQKFMNRSVLNLLLFLVAIFLLASCQNEENQALVPTATTTLAAARGEESPGEAETPAATLPPATKELDTEAESSIGYSFPFEVRPDGFSFRNYGATFPEGNFTIADLRAEFGDGVCSRIEGNDEECIPSAEAQQWIDDRNVDMEYGHCIGFTVTSYRFAQGDIQPTLFSPDASTPYDLTQDIPIMRTIAVNGSLYWVQSVWSSEVSGTPRDIIDALIALGEPVDLSIFLPGLVGGHSLLAYGVEQVEPQRYHILAYDNNFPGEEVHVEVNYEANTWRYGQGAGNPEEMTTIYEGDSTTETLRYIPLSAYDTASCPFCPPELGAEEAGGEVILLSLLGQGDVLIKTALGTIGSVAGEIINEIPGARHIFQRGQLSATDAPDIVLPADTDFTVEFSNLERVSSLGQDLSLVIDQLDPSAENNQLIVDPTNQSVDFQAGGDQSPSLNVTIRQEDASYKVSLLGGQFADGDGLSIRTDETGGGLELRSQAADLEDTTLLLTRLTDEEEALFATSSLEIEDGGAVLLDIEAWNGSGQIDVYADEDGDGNYDEQPIKLPNQPLNDLLMESGADGIISIIDTVSPFLGEQDLETTLVSLTEQDLTGQEIGEILQPLQLTDEQLINLITTYSLPLPGLGELLFALRLEPMRLDTIIAALEFEEEDEAALLTHLANLALYHEIMVEWDFLNSDDLAQLVSLLNAHDLTSDQLGELLPRMELSTAEIEQVLGDLDLAADDLTKLTEILDIDMSDIASPSQTVTTPLTATVTLTNTATPTLTPSPTLSGTLTATLSVNQAPTQTPSPLPTVEPTDTPDPYPVGPTDIPDPYPVGPTTTPEAYPVTSPTDTPDPEPYPGAIPTETSAFLSVAVCVDNNLQVIAQEPTWNNADISVSSDEGMLFSGTTGENGEPFMETVSGPGTWTNLYIESSIEPTRVPLGTVTCP